MASDREGDERTPLPQPKPIQGGLAPGLRERVQAVVLASESGLVEPGSRVTRR